MGMAFSFCSIIDFVVGCRRGPTLLTQASFSSLIQIRHALTESGRGEIRSEPKSIKRPLARLRDFAGYSYSAS